MLRIASRAYATLLIGLGAALSAAGGYLVALGGTAYYASAGIALALAGVQFWRRKSGAGLLFVAALVATVVWTLWESVDPWVWGPQLAAWCILGLPLLFAGKAVAGPFAGMRRRLLLLPPALSLAAAIGLGANTLRSPRLDPRFQAGTVALSDRGATVSSETEGEWSQWGYDEGGSRHSDLRQLDRGTVGKLRVAWRQRIALTPGSRHMGLKVTPLMVQGRVYACNSGSELFALDAETGRILWTRKTSPIEGTTCRGVAHARMASGDAPCAARIIAATGDSKLVALDARTGAYCAAFGRAGKVDLLEGMSRSPAGYYAVTSPPIIVRGRIVVGGWVTDGQYWGEPSGVIRAYDARTGQLSWAWDMGNPGQGGVPHKGQTYTPGTPNSWAPMSADEKLGLVFVPTGNATPDYYGGQRRSFDDAFSSSVVAIDVTRGQVRWAFQTVHHDLWDYDVASQPMLVDLPRTDRPGRPAVLQLTKRGEIFVLDRATGKPILPVTEHVVPREPGMPGERLSRTQPFSDAVPSFRGPPVEERDMWGLTPLDRLWCRIRFRQARYSGQFTPPGTRAWLQSPGFIGGMNWGSATYDRTRGVIVFGAMKLATYHRLIPRAEADRRGIRPVGANATLLEVGARPASQRGTPYAVEYKPFLSPLGVPCQAPPFGLLSAVDLKTGRLVWSRPLGGPLDMGMPATGGAISTASGLTFIAATPDATLRAFDTITGQELWHGSLPRGAYGTPISYWSKKSERQFVLIAAGGAPGLGGLDDAELVAFALPSKRETSGRQ